MYRHLPLKKRPVNMNNFNAGDSYESICYYPSSSHEIQRNFSVHGSDQRKPQYTSDVSQLNNNLTPFYKDITCSSISGKRESKSNICNDHVMMMKVGSDENSDQRDKSNSDEKRLLNCVYCEKEFNSQSMLNAHVRRHKSKEEGIHQCEVCSKTFSQNSNLVVHQSVHSGDRPYRCSQCDATFKHPSSLNTHLLIHTGEKPYCCPICGRSFIQSGNMNRHMKRKICRKNKKPEY